MTIDIKKDAIDIGIVTRDVDAVLAFYQDVIGLEMESVMEMPGGGVMNRLKVGNSIIKVIKLDPEPDADAAPGGIRGATGYRYWTITVGNLAACVQRAKDAGHKIVVPAKDVRPGVTIAIIADPEGNWLELLQTS